MAKRFRRKAEEELVQVLACGGTVETAIQQCGLSKATIYRRLGEEEFRRKLQVYRADMLSRTSGELTAAGSEVVRTLLELQKGDKAPNVRLGMPRRCWRSASKMHELVDTEDRLAGLEKQLQIDAE